MWLPDWLHTALAWLLILAVVGALAFLGWTFVVGPILESMAVQQAAVNARVRGCILESGRDYQTCYFLETGQTPSGDND